MSRTKFPPSRKVYDFSKRNEVNLLFQKYFKISISSFYDGQMSMIFKRITIDMFKFDDWLHDQIGDYESKGLSMNTALANNYGLDARNLIESLIQ